MLVLSACSARGRKVAHTKNTQDLIQDLENETDISVRIAAARRLGESKDTAAVDELMNSLNDDSVVVQTVSASALGSSTDSRVPEALWAALRDPKRDRMFRLAAAVSLANLHDARAVEPLMAQLAYSPTETSDALIGLGRAAVPKLAAALRHPETRESAAQLLTSIGHGADALIPLLDKKESRFTRTTAAALMADLNDSPTADNALYEATKDNDPEMIAAAYRFLIRQGRPESVNRMVRALETHGTAEMAEDFFSSGNDTLREAAGEWATNRGVSLAERTAVLPEVHWPGTDPEIKRLGLYHFDRSLNSSTGAVPAESAKVSFVPGKWETALSVDNGGILKYPLAGNIDFHEGTIELWISPKLEGNDPIYTRYNHAFIVYQAQSNSLFSVSQGSFGGFYGGAVVKGEYVGAGGGNMANWKSGTWHHIAFTWSERARRQRFYIDGAMTAQNDRRMPMPETDSAGTFTVGCDPWKNWTAFSLDELEISSGEKTADAIRRHSLRELPDR